MDTKLSLSDLPSKPARVLITGPRCSGKTNLAQDLAEHWAREHGGAGIFVVASSPCIRHEYPLGWLTHYDWETKPEVLVVEVDDVIMHPQWKDRAASWFDQFSTVIFVAHNPTLRLKHGEWQELFRAVSLGFHFKCPEPKRMLSSLTTSKRKLRSEYVKLYEEANAALDRRFVACVLNENFYYLGTFRAQNRYNLMSDLIRREQPYLGV